LEKHPDVVRQFIGSNTGVYALYKKGRLYYVGLATKLRNRLKAHGKNRHGKEWDSFSIYLTNRDQHLSRSLKSVVELAEMIEADRSRTDVCWCRAEEREELIHDPALDHPRRPKGHLCLCANWALPKPTTTAIIRTGQRWAANQPASNSGPVQKEKFGGSDW
jgi:hypothetical protein